MRIIAGNKARTPLLSPKDQTTRPITDRVKENLFNILQFHLEDAVVADLFCGTGSMGLESLSRGAASALFVDGDRDAVTRLKKNIAKCGFEAQATVLMANAFKTEKYLRQKYDVIFVDPPYKLSQNADAESLLGRMMNSLHQGMNENGRVILRHDKRAVLQQDYDGLTITDRRRLWLRILTNCGKSSATSMTASILMKSKVSWA